MSEEEIQVMIDNALARQRQEIYKEIADSIAGAGELDCYNFQSIEAQCSAYAARDIADRIKWLVEE